jgi:hypothetical protein
LVKQLVKGQQRPAPWPADWTADWTAEWKTANGPKMHLLLAGWLADELIGWLIGALIGWGPSWPAGWLALPQQLSSK